MGTVLQREHHHRRKLDYKLASYDLHLSPHALIPPPSAPVPSGHLFKDSGGGDRENEEDNKNVDLFEMSRLIEAGQQPQLRPGVCMCVCVYVLIDASLI